VVLNVRRVGPTPKAGPNGGRAKAPSPTKAGNGDLRGCFAGHFLGPRILVVWRGLLGAWESRPLRRTSVDYTAIFEGIYGGVNGTRGSNLKLMIGDGLGSVR
jgi:hypothetical protein